MKALTRHLPELRRLNENTDTPPTGGVTSEGEHWRRSEHDGCEDGGDGHGAGPEEALELKTTTDRYQYKHIHSHTHTQNT